MTYAAITSLALTWGLGYFVILFAIVVALTLWPSRKATFRDAALIPLRDDQPERRP